MIHSYESHRVDKGHRFAIVVSRFNELVTRRLLEGALDALRQHGVEDKRISVAWVPGSFEIPLVASRLARTGGFAAGICPGAGIRGETGHYDAVVSAVTAGVSRAALDSGLPVIFGVLTTDTLEKALDRAGGKAGNKGYEAAVSALEMANLMTSIG